MRGIINIKAAKSSWLISCATVVGLGGHALAAEKGVTTDGATTAVTSSATGKPAATVDYANAKPMPLPLNRTYSASRAKADAIHALTAPAPFFGMPGGESGSVGTGEMKPERVAPAVKETSNNGVTPQDFGTSNLPFSTARADTYTLTVTGSYPYRAAGKLFFMIGTSSYVCSASLIKRGIVVTAAHCVANYGKKQFYSAWMFIPGYSNGTAPYGTWSVAQARVLTAYYDGTDPCAQSGVVCQDDVAVMALNTQGSAYPGTTTGWFGYGYNGYGFTGGITHISQLGYPVALDSGVYMERNDSQGTISSSSSNNTVIGSLMTGGSSGGPWLINLGKPPVLSGISFGSAPGANDVVGVTSWGATNTAVKNQGASSFTSTNIAALLTTECKLYPAACS